ncbi:probable E3 ubiquitin-protein ligase HERC4 isoform X2 [Belonocnema kinseyi]|uniref:probable E3 ubiquitin-protein ligase HERC4 isoform X2 n=1 Tax=Belonocnema kinseyi TaxID=2817044 RepID=UPI00143DE820|nr:probable E3 ubiquitin-protein ligase HERC4 isoform X2 [Belonocnema kinseyi]
MTSYYSGLNSSSLFSNTEGVIVAIDRITKIPFPGITSMEIGWNYFLLWRNEDLFISGKLDLDSEKEKEPKMLQIPDKKSGSPKIALAGPESVTILSANNDLWQYKIFEKRWKKVSKFISDSEDGGEECVVKIAGVRCLVALTNLGRVFNIPTLVEMQKRLKFVDIACGFDHTIMLSDNGDVYSMGMGTRGQLGHGDLEDCDNPKIIEALAGLKVSQIAASGWHSAVVTSQGDLYSWGWNTNGELGILNSTTKVVASPTIVDFQNEKGDILEVNVSRVQCGNAFTVCLLDGTLWGAGSNKYGQLGESRKKITQSNEFIPLGIDLGGKCLKDFKCQEWGIYVSSD